jgi:hypothetical protein
MVPPNADATADDVPDGSPGAAQARFACCQWISGNNCHRSTAIAADWFGAAGAARVRGGAVAVFMIHGNLLGIIKLSTFARAALRRVISIS